ILELDGLGIRWRELCGCGRDLAIADGTLARRMRDDAVGDRELAGRNIPLRSCGLQQHDTRRRPSASNIVLRGADAAAAAGTHLAPCAFAGEIAARRDALGRHLI